MASLLRDLPLRGILIYVSNTFCFSLISFLVKELSEEFRVAELLLVRFSCTFLGLVVLIQFRGGFYILKTRKTLDLAIRSGAGMIAIALSFVMGFLGVMLITRPGFSEGSPALYAALGSALFFAIVTVWLRRLNKTEHPLAISFYYNFTGSLIFLLWTWSGGWSEAWGQNLEMLLLLGLLGIIQQVMLTYSFRYAEASLLAPFDYLTLPLALLFGFWFWNEFPDWMSLLGSAVIVLSGMMLMVGQWKGLFSAAKFDKDLKQ